MMKKFVFSLLRKEYATSRRIERTGYGEQIIAPVTDRGGAVSYGQFIDTSEPYATVEEVIKNHYQNYQKGNLLEYGELRGNAWLVSDEGNSIWSVFAHQVTQPGEHYIIEWKKRSYTSRQPYNEDYSPLYISYDEALGCVIEKVSTVMSEWGPENVTYEVDTVRNRFVIAHPQSRMEHELQIIPLYITEETYDNATNNLPEEYHIVRPWTHFKRPNHINNELTAKR